MTEEERWEALRDAWEAQRAQWEEWQASLPDEVRDALARLADRPMHRDPTGDPIDMLAWGQLKEVMRDEIAAGAHEGWWGIKTFTEIDGTEIEVSTVWLGLDHQYLDGPHITWETMIFGGPYSSEVIDRYTTRAQAINGHERTLRALRAGRDPWEGADDD